MPGRRNPRSFPEPEKSEGLLENDFCYAGTLAVQGNAWFWWKRQAQPPNMERREAMFLQAEKVLTPLQNRRRVWLRSVPASLRSCFFLSAHLPTATSPVIRFQERLIKSILSGVTLAMAMIPEEFPVVLTVFPLYGSMAAGQEAFPGASSAVGRDTGSRLCPLCG